MSRTTILIADDHRVLIEGVKSILREKDEFEVVAEAVTGQEAVDHACRCRPDIVIMDISMPGIDGIEATRRIKRQLPHSKLIIYTMHSDPAFIDELYNAGISGYVLKGGPISDLLTALEAVQKGEDYFTSTAPHNLLSNTLESKPSERYGGRLDTLSSREREVFCMLADGHSIKAIAKKLFISPKTVETHKYKIMTKLSVDSLPQLTKLAIKHKMINI